ncbi:MAG: preprotein translocase subunit SecE [Labilithrix sp.]|nr:preprotein translocase subunit SecE [Labilithrix sp.]MBX3220955.1 preprotein translocase subunit SecE [Labilithrix sp.]
MATEEDLKKAEAEDESGEPEESDATDKPAEAGEEAEVRAEADSETDEAKDTEAKDAEAKDAEAEDDGGTPIQLGYQRYVYAAYMAGALLTAFLVAKIGHAAWYRAGQWKPELGEPQDELLFPAAGLVGVAVAVYYWRKVEARQYVNEVAEELSKVTWPSRKEVTNSTTVVVLTTIFATVFFALMDRFWGFITDKIYTF